VELVDVNCHKGKTLDYRDQFLYFRVDPELEAATSAKHSALPHSPEKINPNILFIGIDSVSHVNFKRFMPKTQELLTEGLGAVEFFGRNKVSASTQGNLMPTITGCKMSRKNTNPESYDEDCTFIWKRFAGLGYRTLRAEDDFGLFKQFYPAFK
jgi:hypothetical protein